MQPGRTARTVERPVLRLRRGADDASPGRGAAARLLKRPTGLPPLPLALLLRPESAAQRPRLVLRIARDRTEREPTRDAPRRRRHTVRPVG
jgi:hypothetical protein